MTTVNATPDPGTTFKRLTPYPPDVPVTVTFGGLKDSGKRETFDTGAVRDSQEGKGRFDLIPLEPIRRLALIHEEGSKKYPERNYELGMPVGRCLNSAIRHLYQYQDGWKDEDHLGQALWNIAAAVTMEERAENGRLPKDLLLDSRKDYLGEH